MERRIFRRLLIANRGEIAIRIARAASALGIETVALHSEDDSNSLHIRHADITISLKGVGPAAYLDQDQILDAAERVAADALHPGYGFLSENAQFAERCNERNTRFVGPRPELLRIFGDKSAARRLAIEAGVPVPKGTVGSAILEEAREFFEAGATALIVKAVSGGGGRGMRIVRQREQLEEAIASSSAEAKAAFGNADVYIEELVENARHIEVQVIGDGRRVVHAGERECTLQRRHQKLIEVAPSPSLAPVMRARLFDAALKMANAVNYEGLGTFEFLLSGESSEQSFAFIECNPRLQVEHTVTEEVLGIDLVKAQIELAAGESLQKLGLANLNERRSNGTAIQLRINMETMDARGETRQSDGTVVAFDMPGGPGVRVDTFGYTGYRPNPRFDSLLAKLVVHVPNGHYTEALSKAHRALSEMRIKGISTNVELLNNLLTHASVVSNQINTQFISDNATDLAQTNGYHGRYFVDHAREGGDMQPAFFTKPEGMEAVVAPMTGSIAKIHVAEGDLVHVRTPVAVIEAMKMQNAIEADVSGVVRRLVRKPGDVVSEGEAILFLEPVRGEVSEEAAEIETAIDHIPESLSQVNQARSGTLDVARPAAVGKVHSRGRRTARTNLAELCDEGSFLEIGSLAVSKLGLHDIEGSRAISAADGLICGYATINADLYGKDNARCIVLSFDPSVYAATMGTIGKRKIERVVRIAERGRLPVVFWADGGGARSGESEDDHQSGAGQMEVFHLMSRLKGSSPLVGIVAGNCFAANAAFAGLCDVIIATGNASIGMAGPAMIEGAGLGKYNPEDVGPAEVHARNGVIDILVETEAEAIEAARRYLSYFQGDSPVCEHKDQRKLRHVVPANRSLAYDMRAAIETLADKNSVTEMRANFGRALITVFARVDGLPVGMMANNPRHLGGALDAEAADKAARFMQYCNTFGLPLISLCDTPGFMVGPAAEKEALVRHVSRMFVVGARMTVPHFSCVLRKCYGLGGIAMNGGSHSVPLYFVSWPTGEFGTMNPEGSVQITRKRELDDVDDAFERAELLRKFTNQIYEHGRALRMASGAKIDEVIDPADTRLWIATGVRAARGSDDSRPTRPFLDTW